MAIREFTDKALSDYYYDVDRGVVMSRKNGKIKPLTWSQARSWYPKRVSMVYGQGGRAFKVSYTQTQIMNMLLPAVPKPLIEARESTVSNDLSLIAPDYAYVMFSRKNQCSQYFFAGTSIQRALEMFAKRGERIAPEDVRILNTVTNKVSQLKSQVVTTYVLA